MEENRLRFRVPTNDDRENVLELRREFEQYNQSMAVGDFGESEDFNEWLTRIMNGANMELLANGRPATFTYLSYRRTDDRLVGVVQIRLQDDRSFFGAQARIAGCVRPTEQGREYAINQIDFARDICRQIGVDRIIASCGQNDQAFVETFFSWK